MEGRFYVPITNSRTSEGIRDHQNNLGKWGIRRRVGVTMAESAPFLSDRD
jgi:hypothetical protein